MLTIGCHLSSSRGYLAMGKDAVKINANTFQFFTIPIGLFLGGFAVDWFFEPLMQRCGNIRWLTALFGSRKGSGAAMMMGVLGLLGILLCLAAGKRLRKYHYCDGDGAD